MESWKEYLDSNIISTSTFYFWHRTHFSCNLLPIFRNQLLSTYPTTQELKNYWEKKNPNQDFSWNTKKIFKKSKKFSKLWSPFWKPPDHYHMKQFWNFLYNDCLWDHEGGRNQVRQMDLKTETKSAPVDSIKIMKFKKWRIFGSWGTWQPTKKKTLFSDTNKC